MELFEKGGPPVKICAPMVRYSKLAFRNLVRLYDCDLAFSPMILADSFFQSQKARDNEFTINEVEYLMLVFSKIVKPILIQEDKPLIVQFAANKAEFFSGAAELVARYCNGVDLNCGCPQRWAWKVNLLMKNLELVSLMFHRRELELVL